MRLSARKLSYRLEFVDFMPHEFICHTVAGKLTRYFDRERSRAFQ